MATRILISKDLNGKAIASNRGRQFSNIVYSQTLTANTPQVITIPDGAYLACFSYSKATPADVYVGYDGSPLPSSGGDILLEDGFDILLEDSDVLLLEGSGFFASGLSLNPDIRWVQPGKELVLVSASNTPVVIEFYSLVGLGLSN